MRSHLSIILSAAFLFACGGDAARIRGQVDAMPDQTVYLCRLMGVETIAVDSAVSHRGRFSIRIPDTEADIFYIRSADATLGNGDGIPVVVDNRYEGDIFVTGNFNTHNMVEVGGTPPNEELRAYRDSVRATSILLQAVEKGLAPYVAEAEAGNADSAVISTLLSKRDSLQSAMNAIRTRFVKANPASVVSAMIVAGEVTSATTATRIDSMLEMLNTNEMGGNAFLRHIGNHRKNMPFKPSAIHLAADSLSRTETAPHQTPDSDGN